MTGRSRATEVSVEYGGTTYRVRADETLLAALQRQGAPVAFSCERGTCRVCLQRCVEGDVPSEAQRGLDPALVAKGYFLPCLCRPTADMTVDVPSVEDFSFTVALADKRWLAPNVMRLWLEPMVELRYRAGQFVNVMRPDGLARSYSLASVYGEEPYLELHVERLPGGLVSTWLTDELKVGDELRLQGPLGDSIYSDADPDQALVLVASGTGMAPLFGVLKDAIRHRHRGTICVFHVGATRTDLYLHAELSKFAQENGFDYFPYALTHADGIPRLKDNSALADVVFAGVPGIRGARIHVAGARRLVERCRRLAQEHGVPAARVLTDPFDGNVDEKSTSSTTRPTLPEVGPRAFAPDPEMWCALREGRLLTAILEDFYSRVFVDERLSPYFQRITKDRIVGKVYSYLRQTFTGEKGYFGDHPRNAHHWMVIDDDLFDYRAALLEECMRRQGLEERFVRRWSALEELFRRDIVKSQPVGRIVDNVEQPIERYANDVITVPSVCDGCGTEINAHETVRYHTRLGTVYGQCCVSVEEVTSA